MAYGLVESEIAGSECEQIGGEPDTADEEEILHDDAADGARTEDGFALGAGGSSMASSLSPRGRVAAPVDDLEPPEGRTVA